MYPFKKIQGKFQEKPFEFGWGWLNQKRQATCQDILLVDDVLGLCLY